MKNKLYNIFQPIFSVDSGMNAKINTYEMLLRDEGDRFPGLEYLDTLITDKGNDRWLQISRQSLHDFLYHHPERRVYINLEPCQFNLEGTWSFLDDVRQAYQQQVAVEITERRKAIHDVDFLDNQIQKLKKMGFDIAIDDVCAGSNSYTFIARQLNAIKRIKLSLFTFKNEDQKTRRSFIQSWLDFATSHKLDFVIEGIANQQLAQEFAGNPTILQQGYYWGKEA
ncbi:EAL domain-containing protein [Limosilactobacillus difficilis]|uniref:EAL domain-containing protein n=1 Tax=Limosilactobacillus difficilis TaxID=2991838 RepID=UPI0024B8F9AD|nr:EAL domain-containing protein [Limosilactobacillus difficilis]